MTTYRPSTYRSVFLGVLAALVLLLALINFTRVLKAAGNLFLVIPYGLGLVGMVLPGDVQRIELGTEQGQVVAFSAAGAYLVYSANAPVLQAAGTMKELILQVTDEDGGHPSTWALARGVRPYDTPLAAGRPFLQIQIPAPGPYRLKLQGVAEGSRYIQALDTTVSIVPDTVTGWEARLQQVYGIQIGLLVLALTPWVRRVWDRRRALRRARRQRRAESDAAWEKLRRGDS